MKDSFDLDLKIEKNEDSTRMLKPFFKTWGKNCLITTLCYYTDKLQCAQTQQISSCKAC